MNPADEDLINELGVETLVGAVILVGADTLDGVDILVGAEILVGADTLVGADARVDRNDPAPDPDREGDDILAPPEPLDEAPPPPFCGAQRLRTNKIFMPQNIHIYKLFLIFAPPKKALSYFCYLNRSEE